MALAAAARRRRPEALRIPLIAELRRLKSGRPHQRRPNFKVDESVILYHGTDSVLELVPGTRYPCQARIKSKHLFPLSLRATRRTFIRSQCRLLLTKRALAMGSLQRKSVRSLTKPRHERACLPKSLFHSRGRGVKSLSCSASLIRMSISRTWCWARALRKNWKESLESSERSTSSAIGDSLPAENFF